MISIKALVLTAPALSNLGIIARHHRFGGGVGAFLPHMARARRHNAGVSPLIASIRSFAVAVPSIRYLCSDTLFLWRPSGNPLDKNGVFCD
jgi:hypothetical protein